MSSTYRYQIPVEQTQWEIGGESTTVFNWLPGLFFVSLVKDPGENLKQMAMPAVALALPLIDKM